MVLVKRKSGKFLCYTTIAALLLDCAPASFRRFAMQDDPRTFRVSGPLPPLGELPAPLPQSLPPSIPDTKKQFLWGLMLGLLPALFGLAGAASGSSFLDWLAIVDFALNLVFAWVLLALSQANRLYSSGLLTGCFCCAFPVLVVFAPA